VFDQRAVNLTSLNIVKGEFLATIQLATNQLEQFISSRERQDLVQSCLESFQQIDGVLRMVQLRGADMLAGEIVDALKSVPVGADASYDAMLAAVSTASFVVTRYFEYVQQFEKSMPVLLLPFINDLRATRKLAPIPDSHFLVMNPVGAPEQHGAVEPFSSDAARRFRHMFQVGLLGVLQGQNADYSLGLMQRALERTNAMASGKPFAKVLWSAAVSLRAIRETHMALLTPRKMLFSALDRQLKQLVAQGEGFLDSAFDESLLRGFVYIVAASGSESEHAKAVRSVFAVMPMGYCESDVEEELNNLRGPGLSTVQSVAEVIREELRSSKNALEMASQGGGDIVATYPDMIASLTRIADTLSVVGLASPGQVLREQVNKIRQWDQDAHAANNSELIEVADTLLYIESTVSALQNINLSQAKLAETNALGKDQIIAKSQLAEAEKVVLDEAQAGLALIKRAMASYAESGFDPIHISNLGKSLNSVRGALILMNMARAAKVAESCIQFVDTKLLRGDSSGAIQQLMETFADAVMSLEYFLEAYIAVHKQDNSILEIAEESVKALGYPVN
jgi:copper chaperone CopZ